MNSKPLAEIDFNADVGEGFGAYTFGNDDVLLQIISSANIACGFHAGDPHMMRRTVELCLEHHVAIGAHPGLPDRLGFGRREMRIAPAEAADLLMYQIGALQAISAAAGASVRHVKLHGAWYHMAARDDEQADAVAGAIASLDSRLIVYGPPDSLLAQASRNRGLKFVAEAFADRAYEASGRLVSRDKPGAVIEQADRVLAQALSIVRHGYVHSIEGTRISLVAGTLCLHGDTPRAAELARYLSDGMQAAGIVIRPPST